MKGLILESSFISKSNSHALEAIVLPAWPIPIILVLF
jgi:hypothetical protein